VRIDSLNENKRKKQTRVPGEHVEAEAWKKVQKQMEKGIMSKTENVSNKQESMG